MSASDIEGIYKEVVLQLQDDLISHLSSLKSPVKVIDRLKKSICANVQSGRQSLALAVVQAALAVQGSTLSNNELKDLCILGWLIQLRISYIYIADDMVDRTKVRRGAPTWWCRPEIGQTAVSDAFVMNFALYHLLNLHFNTHPGYLSLVHLFHENSLLIEIGQSADHLMSCSAFDNRAHDRRSSGKFFDMTEENYWFIVTHKSGYLLYMNAALALVYLQLNTPKNISQLLHISIEFGKYAQVQDDFLDAFADPKESGKIGTDIQEGKCSWLLIQALQRCDAGQLDLLEAAYGIDDDEQVAKVKRIYTALHLERIFYKYEERTLKHLEQLVQSLDEGDGLKKALFYALPIKNVHYRSVRQGLNITGGILNQGC